MISDGGAINPINLAGFEVYCGMAPKKQPRAMRAAFDFSLAQEIVVDGNIFGMLQLDLQIPIDADRLEWIQAVFYDNSLNPNSLQLQFSTSNQNLLLPANSQGYLAVLAPKPTLITALTGADYTGAIPIHLLSFPVANCIWKV